MLKTIKKLVLVDINQGISKNTGQPYCFVKLANPETFESYSTSVRNDNLSFDNVQNGDYVTCEFDMKDYNGRLNVALINIEKWAKNAS